MHSNRKVHHLLMRWRSAGSIESCWMAGTSTMLKLSLLRLPRMGRSSASMGSLR